MNRFILIAIGVSVLMGSGTVAARDNPFGFETTKHPRDYGYCTKVPGLHRGHGYDCTSAPRPHPQLVHYILQFVEGVGLCTIESRVDALEWPDAIALQLMFLEQIEGKYGPHDPDPDVKVEQEWTERDGIGYLSLYRWKSPAGSRGRGQVAAFDLVAFETFSAPRNWVEVVVTLGTNAACQTRIDTEGQRAF